MSLKIWLAIAAVAAMLGGLALMRSDAYQRGRADEKVEAAADNSRRLNDATRADDDALRCSGDPDCRLRSDGFRRD